MKKVLDSGIYFIINGINGHYYIGSSKDMGARFKVHFSMLKNNSHINVHLQNAVNKYGLDKFKFKRVESVELENLLSKEQKYLNEANWNVLYNMNRESNSGGSDYTKKRVILLDLEGLVLEEFASFQDIRRYFGSTTQVHTPNTDRVYKRAYRLVTFDFYEKNRDDILMWRNYTSKTRNKELIEERIEEINRYRTSKVGIKHTYRSAESENFAFNAF